MRQCSTVRSSSSCGGGSAYAAFRYKYVKTILVPLSNPMSGLLPLEYHHFLMISLILAIVFYSEPPIPRESTGPSHSSQVWCLPGAPTDAGPIRNIYLTSLSYQNTPVSTSDSSALVNPNLTATFAALANSTSLEVRASYFGLCVRGSGGPPSWLCGDDTAR